MSAVIALSLLILALAGSFLFSTLSYALRDYSKAGLGEWFERKQRKSRGDKADLNARVPVGDEAAARADAVADNEDELALAAGLARIGTTLIISLSTLHLVATWLPGGSGLFLIYAVTFLTTFMLVAVFGVVLPLATSSHAAESAIGTFAKLLRIKRAALWPVVKLHGPIDTLVRRATGRSRENAHHVEQEIEQEILDIVNEGRDEGVIDESERVMIERTLRFQDVIAEQAMTPRGDVVGLPEEASIETILEVIDKSGYSRIPVYRDTLDHVIGVLYARDLFPFVGKQLDEKNGGNGEKAAEARVFDIHEQLRKPLVVPESKRLADLLRDMQLQKIHMAIVLDEYGGTSGLVTIEDVIEELVGDIADEHEDAEDAMFDRESPNVVNVDARIGVEELNRLMGLHLTENDAYETLGGYITTTLGRIPDEGTSFERETDNGKRVAITILGAEPQRVNRVRLEITADDVVTE